MKYAIFLCSILLILHTHALMPVSQSLEVETLEALQDQLTLLEKTSGPDALRKARFVQHKIDRLQAQMGDPGSQRWLGTMGKAERLTTIPGSPQEIAALWSHKTERASSSKMKKASISTESRGNQPLTGMVLDGDKADLSPPPRPSAPSPAHAPPQPFISPTLMPSEALPSAAPPLSTPPPVPVLRPPQAMPSTPHALTAHGLPILGPSPVIRTPLGLVTILSPTPPAPMPLRTSFAAQPAPQHSCSHDPRHLFAVWK